jgi:ankyrin repeat protein
MTRLLACLLTFLFLTSCGDHSSALPSFMRTSYPATKYFTGPLLPLAQAIENDDLRALEQHLTQAPGNKYQNVEQAGMSLLLYAMMNRRKEAMGILLDHHADPNQNTHLGESKLQIQPVGIAAGGEDQEILKILLDHGGNPNSYYEDKPALFIAADAGRFEQMHLLLDKGADMNLAAPDGRTAVMVLADHADFDQVIDLIKRGADIHKSDNNGATLAFAVQSRYVSPSLPEYKTQQVVKQLLTERGIQFPVPHPGIALQAKVRQENQQRHQWEATVEGAQWLARINAAEALTTAAGANEAMQLRQQAEPIFQVWRKAQPGWTPTTNGGSFPLYNSPSDQDLAPEPTDSAQ